MEKKLIRMLSTGRVGTKFVAAVFADQGYRAFHENLYHGEPGSAIIQYLRMLGDLWVRDRESYYALDSDFAQPYIRAVFDALTPQKLGGWLKRKGSYDPADIKNHVVIHSGHRLSTATPLIEKEASKQELDVMTIILFRNPLKTIHAIYTVEGQTRNLEGPYRMRPELFFSNGSPIGAAEIWANTYRMAQDHSTRLAKDRYTPLNLERFSTDINYARQIFASLGLPFQEIKFHAFVQQLLNKPLRETKTDDARNSHIFHDPDFSFSDNEIREIYPLIKEVLDIYSLDWDVIVEEYKTFHKLEKQQIGFG